jgi:hypothetical protein
MALISSFNLDLSDVREAGETREFKVVGSDGAIFSLEIKNEVGEYYNFKTNLFQTAKTTIKDIIISGGYYQGNIKFPLVTRADQYDISLMAGNNTEHDTYNEVRFLDGSMDINSTTGSNSRLIQKVIYQTLDVNLSIACYSTSGATTGGVSTQVITGSSGKNIAVTPISVTLTASSGAVTIDRQPLGSDMIGFVQRTIGGSPIEIPGENIYPTESDSDNTAAIMSGTDLVTMATNVVDKVKVGDRVIGTGISSSDTVTVLNITDGTAKQFRASQNVSIGSGVSLGFWNRRNYIWPIDNIHGLEEGMEVITETLSNNFTGTASIQEYVDETIIFEDDILEESIVNIKIPALDTLSVKPTLTRNSTTKIKTTTQTGNISFSQGAAFSMANSTQKIFASDVEGIAKLSGYDVEFIDLKAELNTISKTTTGVVSGSTTIPVNSTLGIADKTTQTVNGATSASTRVILDSVTGLGIGQSLYAGSGLVGTPTILAINEATKTITLSSVQTFADGITLTFPNSIINGIGINANVVSPYVDTISSLNLTASAAQTLESGQTFTFTGAGSVVTITGYIKVNNVGYEDLIIRVDVDKFLTSH